MLIGSLRYTNQLCKKHSSNIGYTPRKNHDGRGGFAHICDHRIGVFHMGDGITWYDPPSKHHFRWCDSVGGAVSWWSLGVSEALLLIGVVYWVNCHSPSMIDFADLMQILV